jgi:hypothetical protein
MVGCLKSIVGVIALHHEISGPVGKGVNMEKVGKEKTANLIHQGVQRRRKLSNSQHVELVIARIFSKQREYANLRVVRPFDLEDTESEA